MAWKVSPQYKKCVTEVELWRNDKGEVLKHTTGWRWGTWIVNDPEGPKLDAYDPEEGIDPYDLGNEVDFEGTDDGDDYGWEFPESWDEAKQEEFLELWDEEWHEAPTKFGFEEDDTSWWITGPLDVEEIADSDDAEDSD